MLSVAQKADGTLRLSMDGVTSDGSVFPEAWSFHVFENHFTLDQDFVELIEKEIQKPLEEMNYTPPPDSLIQMLGHALLVPLISAAIDARKAGVV